MGSEYITLKEAAKFLRIGVATLHRLLKEEAVPTYKIGGRRLFDKSELDDWVKKHKSSFGAQKENGQ